MLAALAPIAASLAIFAFTRSPFALIFAFLGPIVAVAGFIDGAIRHRRLRRSAHDRFDADTAIATSRISAWHEYERARLDAAHPAIHQLLRGGARHSNRWSHDGTGAVFVSVGRGRVPSGLDLASSAGRARLSDATTADRTLEALSESARWIDGAPILLDAREGIAVCGSFTAAHATARAIVVRIAHVLSPADIEVRASVAAEWNWLDELPHRRIEVAPQPRESEVHMIEFVRLRADARSGSPEVIARLAVVPDPTLAPRAGGLILAGAGGGATLEVGSDRITIAPEYCTATEAEEYAIALAAHAARQGLVTDAEALPTRVEFASLDNTARQSETARSLACALGQTAQGLWIVDLVTDGPHAVIGGTTGSGKSELLVSWVLALAARYPPEEVSVLLVDFKGGAAFTHVADLANTVGVLSDLDTVTARRAIESLAAEIRHRERVLLAAAARSIDELPLGASLSRLVVFVDEFAALAHDFPDLRDLFVDLAARGRSLGVHLVLCTQRPADVMRDAILANVTLRISLRVNDRSSSMALLGSPIAATLPRGALGRAAVSLAGEEARIVQVALAGDADLRRAQLRWAKSPLARRPWCDPLPTTIGREHPLVQRAANVFAVADRPSEQRQTGVTWLPPRDGNVIVQGARRSGRSTAVHALCRSWPDAAVHFVAHDLEAAYDLLSTIAARVERSPPTRAAGPDPFSAPDTPVSERPPAVADASAEALEIVAIDDLDHLIALAGADQEGAFVDLLARLMRQGPKCGLFVVAAVHRVTPALSGLVALCDERLLLHMASRQDHVLAHGRGDDHNDHMPPGGGWWKGDRVQVIVDSAVGGLISRNRVADVDEAALCGGDSRVLAVVSPFATALVTALQSTHVVIDIREPGALRAALERVIRSTPGAEFTAPPPIPPLALVGDVDSWHAAGAALTAVRAAGLVVVHGCSVAEFRSITRVRQHPPPLNSPTTRAWVLHPDGAITRCSV